MKLKHIYLFLILMLVPAWTWGATVYVKDIGGTVYYESGASSCDDVTNGDTAGDLEAALTAAGASGVLNICAGTYTETEIDADSNLLVTNNGQTINGIGTVILDANAVGSYALVMSEKNTIAVNNIQFQGGTTANAWIQSSCHTISFTDCIFTAADSAPGVRFYIANNGADIHDITFTSCTFSNNTEEDIHILLSGDYDAGYTDNIYNLTIDSCNFSGSTRNSVLIDIDSTGDRRLHAYQNGRIPYGIDIKNSTWTSSGAAAIAMLCKDTTQNYIRDNTFSNTGSEAYTSNCLSIHAATGLIIERNTQSNHAGPGGGDGCGIMLDWRIADNTEYITDGVIVRENKFLSNTDADTTGAGIHVYRAKNCEIYNNLSALNTIGFYQDANVCNIGNVFHDNTVVDNTGDGAWLRADTPSTPITNCIFSGNGGEQINDDSANDPLVTYTDLFPASDYSGFTLGTGCIELDPLLDANYNLGPGSPCINAGAPDGTGGWSEVITAVNDRNFQSGTIGNWVVFKDGTGTCAYDTTDIGGPDDKQGLLTSTGDSYLRCELTVADDTTMAANKTYLIRAWGYTPAANTLKDVRFVTASFTGETPDYEGGNATLAGDTWTEISYQLAVAALGGGAKIQIGFNGNPTDGDLFYYNNISFRESTGLYSSAVQDLNDRTITDASGDALPRFGSRLDIGAYEHKQMGNLLW